ncbi:MAG: CDC48 family AAA ATPase [Nanoarchaeota archaeon]
MTNIDPHDGKNDDDADRKELHAKVQEGLQSDVGKKIARMSSHMIDALELDAGDAVVLEGKKKTIATVWRARPEDDISTENTIRVDGNIRHNAGVSLGEKITISKAECKDAKNMAISILASDDLPDEFVQVISQDESVKELIKSRILDKPFTKGDFFAIHNLIFRVTQGQIQRPYRIPQINFVVSQTAPKGFIRFTKETELNIASEKVSPEDIKAMPEVTYEDIGGLDEEVDQIREMVELPMKHPEVFERLGVGAPKGVLLTGPPGTGKTLLAKAVAGETESNFYSINGPEIMSKFYGESEKQLREVFEKAEKNAPSIIFIDEIDSIAANRSETTGEVERRVVAQMLTLMDGLKTRGQVVVIAATNRDDALDPALRRPGRFDREITINPPDQDGRKEVIQIHTRGMPLSDNVDFDKLAEITVGYTGADIEALAKEAALKSLKNYIPDLKHFEERVPENVLEKIKVKMDHFIEAFRKIEPSAMREVLIRRPTTTYDDIGGLETVKTKLKETIEWPMKNGEMFKKAGITPPKGVILSGPPGTGKTLLAKAVANESQANFISVKGPELISKWVGESEKRVREIFKKARQVAPSIIFFDEFDSIASRRSQDGKGTSGEERVVNQLLTELDGIEELSGVTVIAATNRVDLIDPALLRPGRFDEVMELENPDAETRREIFSVHTKSMPITESIDFGALVAETENLTGAEIANICKDAGLSAIRKALADGKDEIAVTQDDFDKAIHKVKEKLHATQPKASYFG